jgi:hypothetical protein
MHSDNEKVRAPAGTPSGGALVWGPSRTSPLWDMYVARYAVLRLITERGGLGLVLQDHIRPHAGNRAGCVSSSVAMG